MPVNPMKQCPVTVSNVPRQAVLYTRVSSKEQELGYSIPAQQELLRSYGAQLGLVIEQELSDAETAKITGRPGFVGMVRYFKQHPACRVLLVEKTDRLYRNFKDYLTIDNLREEVQKGLHTKAAQGLYPSYAPLGYLNVVGPDGKRIIVPDPILGPM